MPEFNARKIRVVAVSVDAPDESERLRRVAHYSFLFLSDETRQVIRHWDLVHKGGGVGGADIARPAEFLLDSNGEVRWVNLTENYLVRARPSQVLQAFDSLHLAE